MTTTYRTTTTITVTPSPAQRDYHGASYSEQFTGRGAMSKARAFAKSTGADSAEKRTIIVAESRYHGRYVVSDNRETIYF